jgi:hypothetical protein
MQRVANRVRALGLLAVCALAQSSSQPDLLVIVRHFAQHAARFWDSFSFIFSGSGMESRLHSSLPSLFSEPLDLSTGVARPDL